MTEGVKTIMYPVTDLANAKTLYGELLGVEPYMDEAYYVGFNVEGQDIGLDPHGHSKGMTGPVAYWHVDDIEEHLQADLASPVTPRLHSHQRPTILIVKYRVLRCGRAIQAVAGRRRYVLPCPPACSMCLRSARVDADAPVEFGARKLLGDCRHVHPLPRADGCPGVEDHDAYLGTRRDVA